MKFCFFFDKLYFFQRNEKTLWGKMNTALFQTHNWEKSSFFNTLVRIFARLFTDLRFVKKITRPDFQAQSFTQ